MRKGLSVLLCAACACLFVSAGAAVSASGNGSRPDADAVAAHWTAERRTQAEPRDLVLDHRGLGYLRGRGGELRPYGHDIPAEAEKVRALSKPTPSGKPGGGGGGDTTPPTIGGMDPSSGQKIGSSYTFQATVTDASGVKSVSFVVKYPTGQTQSYGATQGANDVWSVNFSGFSNGSWAWQVVAKDWGAKGGNTATSSWVSFTVDTSGGGGGGGGGSGGSATTNAEWTGGGQVQTAAGRIYFEMPANRRLTKWNGYVCSGTAVTDTTANVSVILTAAHCVYDDVYKVFARNVLFIPDQASTTGSGTDLNCSNDPLGCWAPSHGVVDSDWSTRKWPDNIPWDYAYYVVLTSGAHSGTPATSESLEEAAGTLGVSFSQPAIGSPTHALGYSYSEDPKLMYCAESMGTEGASNWWLSQCGLSGGSSGGPWLQPVSGGDGPVISVNSWGYSGSPGMAGPKLWGTSASCVFGDAQTKAPNTTGGYVSSCN